MNLAQALTRVLVGVTIREAVKVAPKDELVLLAKGVKLSGRNGDLLYVPRDEPDAGE